MVVLRGDEKDTHGLVFSVKKSNFAKQRFYTLWIMITHPLWNDEYWLPLLQLYLKSPTGVKKVYSRGMVDLSLDIHIPPTVLHELMFHLRNKRSPIIRRLWQRYGENHKLLDRKVKCLRQMRGFGHQDEFYEGVKMNETFERDFRPLQGREDIKPVMLILILDLYFRLTPITMAEDTPEIQELSKLIKETPKTVVDVMDVFLVCDPYISEYTHTDSPLLPSCKDVWQRFGNDDLEALAALAAQLKEYFSRMR